MADTNIQQVVAQALVEDLGSGDVSAALLDETLVDAHIICRESAVLCGIAYASEAFAQLDQHIRVDWAVEDGQGLEPGQTICHIRGNARAIISAERVALNFLQTLSATATQTRALVDCISHTQAKLLDTRKTIPGLRLAQKYAVTCGGGENHRIGLYDAVMLKENHIAATGSITAAAAKAQSAYPSLPLIVEVETLAQLQEALALSGITRILCDNFELEQLAQAVKLATGIYPLEASGNIDRHNIAQVAETGVDYISIGSITKHIQAIDFSLRFV